MRSISETTYFSSRALDLLERVELAIAVIHHRKELRCHEVARAIGEFFGVHVVDGYFGVADHSWCTFEDHSEADRFRQYILDPYAVGRLPQVQLITVSGPVGMAAQQMYREAAPRTDIDATIVSNLISQLRVSPHMHGFVPLRERAKAVAAGNR